MLEGLAGRFHSKVYIVGSSSIDGADLLFSTVLGVSPGCATGFDVPSRGWEVCSYEGFIEVIFCSLLDLTNSPLMRRPNGWDHFFPLGAESSTSMVEIGFV